MCCLAFACARWVWKSLHPAVALPEIRGVVGLALVRQCKEGLHLSLSHQAFKGTRPENVRLHSHPPMTVTPARSPRTINNASLPTKYFDAAKQQQTGPSLHEMI